MCCPGNHQSDVHVSPCRQYVYLRTWEILGKLVGRKVASPMVWMVLHGVSFDAQLFTSMACRHSERGIMNSANELLPFSVAIRWSVFRLGEATRVTANMCTSDDLNS